ncbi:MAG: hypothetical protein EZS28_018333, partial [Streblomastix strix]
MIQLIPADPEHQQQGAMAGNMQISGSGNFSSNSLILDEQHRASDNVSIMSELTNISRRPSYIVFPPQTSPQIYQTFRSQRGSSISQSISYRSQLLLDSKDDGKIDDFHKSRSNQDFIEQRMRKIMSQYETSNDNKSPQRSPQSSSIIQTTIQSTTPEPQFSQDNSIQQSSDQYSVSDASQIPGSQNKYIIQQNKQFLPIPVRGNSPMNQSSSLELSKDEDSYVEITSNNKGTKREYMDATVINDVKMNTKQKDVQKSGKKEALKENDTKNKKLAEHNNKKDEKEIIDSNSKVNKIKIENNTNNKNNSGKDLNGSINWEQWVSTIGGSAEREEIDPQPIKDAGKRIVKGHKQQTKDKQKNNKESQDSISKSDQTRSSQTNSEVGNGKMDSQQFSDQQPQLSNDSPVYSPLSSLLSSQSAMIKDENIKLEAINSHHTLLTQTSQKSCTFQSQTQLNSQQSTSQVTQRTTPSSMSMSTSLHTHSSNSNSVNSQIFIAITPKLAHIGTDEHSPKFTFPHMPSSVNDLVHPPIKESKNVAIVPYSNNQVIVTHFSEFFSNETQEDEKNEKLKLRNLSDNNEINSKRKMDLKKTQSDL